MKNIGKGQGSEGDGQVYDATGKPEKTHTPCQSSSGRLHRNYDRKIEVIIYDYVDDQVPVLAGMFGKRKKGYKAIGYELDL